MIIENKNQYEKDKWEIQVIDIATVCQIYKSDNPINEIKLSLINGEKIQLFYESKEKRDNAFEVIKLIMENRK